MWDWSNSKKTNASEDLSKENTKAELNDLFSFDDVGHSSLPPKKDETKNAEILDKKDDDKKDETKEVLKPTEKAKVQGFGVSDFSLNKSLKSGAKEIDANAPLAKSITPIPPPPPALKGATPFIRPNVSKEHHQNDDKKGVSNVYAGAIGLREEVPPHGDKSMWELQLRQAGLPGMALAEVSYSPIEKEWHADLMKGFKRIRRDFFKYIGYHNVNDLVTAGIDENGIRLLKAGRAPENFDIHIKIPLEYGGNNEFSNLCLIQTRPFHDAIHRFIDMQTSNLHEGEILRSIFIPIPSGKIYIPEVEISVGGGRKMADKSVYAGFLSDTFKEIAIKSMYGRSRSLD